MKRVYWFLSLAVIFGNSTSAQMFTRVKDIDQGPGSSIPQPHINLRFADINGMLFFVANNGANGYELWKTDGTAANTVMIKDLNPGLNGSDPLTITNLNGIAIFQASAPGSGSELWKSDGTESGTFLLKDINPGPGGALIGGYLTRVNNLLYFSATNGAPGYELWKTDGTAEGTVMVKDIYAGPNSSNPQNLVNVNGILYFYASTANGNELWKSNGTSEGTVLVKDINPGPGNSSPQNMTAINGLLYFYANNGVNGWEPWISNGTETGTVLLKDINPGTANSFPEWFTELDGRVIFSAGDAANGTEIWMSDGTEAGTVMVKDVYPGTTSGSQGYLQKLDNLIYFIGTDAGPSGMALWKTDGTGTGTEMVKDIWPGTTSGTVSKFLTLNNTLFFIATDMSNGAEDLWTSNGAAPGTFRILQNINNNIFGPHWLVNSGTKLFIDVTDDPTGREFWAADISLISLPVTLSDLKGQLAGSDGLLSWKTLSEQNTSHFEIERSTNGRNFIQAGTVTAAGHSIVTRQYSYTDRNITALNVPVVYYRLKTNDVDGRATYSKLIAININSREAVVMLYPNPVRENATLMIAVSKKDNIDYSIIDNHGRIVQRKEIAINEGSNMITVGITSLASGVYTIVLKGATTNRRIKFVRQ